MCFVIDLSIVSGMHIFTLTNSPRNIPLNISFFLHFLCTFAVQFLRCKVKDTAGFYICRLKCHQFLSMRSFQKLKYLHLLSTTPSPFKKRKFAKLSHNVHTLERHSAMALSFPSTCIISKTYSCNRRLVFSNPWSLSFNLSLPWSIFAYLDLACKDAASLEQHRQCQHRDKSDLSL